MAVLTDPQIDALVAEPKPLPNDWQVRMRPRLGRIGHYVRTVSLLGRQIGQFVERRRAEAERDRSLSREREARRELSGILESISDAFFAVDREWRFTYVNRRAEELWSRSREDLLGKDLWEIG